MSVGLKCCKTMKARNIILFLVVILAASTTVLSKSIYVVGLESSGTRALSRLIASMTAPAGQRITWNGESPFCYANIHHVSLPFNSVCGKTLPRISNSNVRCDGKHDGSRFILNISNVLHTNDRAIAVIITRSLRSVWKSTNGKHCWSSEIFLKESKASIKVMSDALNRFPSRTLLISYHSMAYFQERTISDINVFLQEHGWRSRIDINFGWHDRDHVLHKDALHSFDK